ncbi:hypothetical protein A1O1_04971 [Capronia coronata CBS 617.96]|uniref:Zn(2)-C6 fungal-type domain-containing protein n=1 Tax=Capronia coronata CBS 617.96 TaxID=1182541 RepID=W9Z0J0_9EURO|nr:uncharacterized protein A1O1_04971 [Capronia coronata CBS 617.96]EXJ88044.1 hypothetical protein A1O1_04971 [Capronia coronata CBS 617.96]
MTLVAERGIKTPRKLRRTHTKSRQGCGNCKLRKVKCDEDKPECQRCRAYNVICTYNTTDPLLQASYDGAHEVEVLLGSPDFRPDYDNATRLNVIPANPPFPTLLNCNQGSHVLDMWNLSLLDRFKERTSTTIGMGQYARHFQDVYTSLALTHPFLLHIMLTLTIMHDRYLGVDIGSKQSRAIAFHWSQGASMLNDKLTHGVQASEKDALWASAVFLATLAFASFDATSPEDAWPMRPSSPTDLDWLKLIEGKKEIWKIADPHRADSIFYPHIPKFQTLTQFLSASDADLSTLPPDLLTVCSITAACTSSTNPYLIPTATLSQMARVECTPETFGVYIGFFTSVDPGFKLLLARKDVAALLVLAHWYAKVCRLKQWWLWRRASFECRAICIYLCRFHTSRPLVRRLVQNLELESDLFVSRPWVGS